MRNDLINCAVVGLGIGEQHALAILDNSRCHLSAIVEFDKEKATQFAQGKKLTSKISTSFDDIVNDATVNLISLASFDDHHFDQVMKCLEQSKHVFVEKPLCQSREQLTAIHSQWKRGNCGLSSNLVLRKAPLYLWLKDIIDQGKLGELYSFDGDYLYGRLHKITQGWRAEIEDYSVMLGGGIHIIDLMMWLTGQRPKAVTSTKNKISTKNTPFRYHDFHSSIFTFDSGLIGRITANFGCVHRHQHALRIFGTKGTFILDDMGPRIHWSRDEKSEPEFLSHSPRVSQKGVLIHDFVDAIDQKQLSTLAQREFELMSVVLATDESLSHLKPLEIEYLACSA